MTPVIEALLIAFMAGTMASVAAGVLNRGIARIKRRRKMKERPRSDDGSGGVQLKRDASSTRAL